MDSRLTNPDESIPQVVFRAGRFEYTVVSILCVALLIIPIIATIKEPSLNNAGVVVLAGAMFGFVYLWLLSFELKVSPVSISCATLFARKKSILIEDLAEVEIKVGGEPTYCLIFRPLEGLQAPTIRMNIKPLKRGDLTRLAIFLPKIAPHVAYDRRFLAMASGKMPSLFSPPE